MIGMATAKTPNGKYLMDIKEYQEAVQKYRDLKSQLRRAQKELHEVISNPPQDEDQKTEEQLRIQNQARKLLGEKEIPIETAENRMKKDQIKNKIKTLDVAIEIQYKRLKEIYDRHVDDVKKEVAKEERKALKKVYESAEKLMEACQEYDNLYNDEVIQPHPRDVIHGRSILGHGKLLFTDIQSFETDVETFRKEIEEAGYKL